METKKIIKSLRIPIGVFTMVLFGTILFLALIYLPPEDLIENSSTLACFYGIAFLILLVGILFLAFFTTWHWFVLIKNEQKLEEKDADDKNKLKQQELLNTDAQMRRTIELDCNRKNDLYRLIELATNKFEKSESVPNGEKSDKLLVRIIDKSEELDLKKLDTLIQHYNKMINNQANTKPDV